MMITKTDININNKIDTLFYKCKFICPTYTAASNKYLNLYQ